MFALLLVLAVPQDDAPMAFGYGEYPCTVWKEAKKEGGASRTQALQWLGGFLSGLEYVSMAREQGHLLKPTDNINEIIQEIDGYCDSETSKTVAKIAGNAVYRLILRARNR